MQCEDFDGNNLEFERSSTPPSSIQQTAKSSLQPPQKKMRLLGPIARQNQLIQKACSFLESSNKPQQEIPIIAKVWGEKLHTLSPQQRLFAEKAINDILFEASLETLHRNSVRINEYGNTDRTF